jgi:hypothetical protein
VTTNDYGIDDAALEQRIAELSDTDFNRIVERTRPHTATTQTPLANRFDFPDPADRQRAIFASIQEQQRKRPTNVNANGYTTGPVNTDNQSHPPTRLPTDTTPTNQPH